MTKIEIQVEDETADAFVIGWLKDHYEMSNPELYHLRQDIVDCRIRRMAIEIILDYCGEEV